MKKLFETLTNFVRWGWMTLGTSFLIFFLIEGVFSLSVKIGLLEDDLSIVKGTMLDEKTPIPESYRTISWFKEYVKEASHVFFHVDWSPYVYWKTQPFKGKYITVNDDSSRKTWSPPINTSKPIYHIFMFGGSTLWGWGARDDYTIPSLIAKILHAKYNVQAQITNFGELGYVSTQEIIRFIKEIRQNNIPQLVIFYDGLNDVFSGLQSGRPGIAHNEFKREKEFKDSVVRKIYDSLIEHSTLYKVIFRIFGRNNAEIQSNLATPEALNNLSEEIISVYKGNISIINAIASSFKIKTLFYWQPVIFTKKDITIFEKSFENIHSYSKQLYINTNEKADDIRETNFYNISDILSGYGASFYIDPWHIDEKGNEVVAKKIAEDISKTLNVS